MDYENFRKKIIETLENNRLSRYWLCQQTGIQKSNMYQFFTKKETIKTLSEKNIQKIKDVLKQYNPEFGYKKWHLFDTDQRKDFDTLDDVLSYVVGMNNIDIYDSSDSVRYRLIDGGFKLL